MSKVIKSYHLPSLQVKERVIGIKNLYVAHEGTIECEEVDSQEVALAAIQHQHQELEIKERQLIDQKREMEEFASQCREQAQLEQEQWLQEKELLIEQAKQQGYNEGLEIGRKDGYEEYLSHLQEAKEIVHSSKNDYDNHLGHSEEAVVRIAMKVSEHIIGTSLEENPDKYLSFVKKVIKEVQEHQHIQLRIHPENYKFVLSNKQELCELISGEIDIYIYPDEELGLYDCMIDSSFGRIDAKVDTQLQEMKVALLEIVEGNTYDNQ